MMEFLKHTWNGFLDTQKNDVVIIKYTVKTPLTAATLNFFEGFWAAPNQVQLLVTLENSKFCPLLRGW